MRRLLAFVAFLAISINGRAQQHYTNPVLHMDYSDPDVCRVGEDYWMTASSFNCFPGLPILHPNDLVHWTLTGSAMVNYEDPLRPGEGVWAPAIRYRDGWFYIFVGDPDRGIFMVRTKDPRGRWEAPVWLVRGKGFIDPCPLWDDDGRAWLSHALAGSRAGLKSVILLAPMSPDGTSLTGPSRIIYDGHDTQPTIEGTKFYKRNGYYYIMSPAGGVKYGWQVELRSKNPYGPYEEYVGLAQGKNKYVNGPHQGAWVDTQNGEDWFIHFQDVGTCGRIIHLEPMKWVNDWPVIGNDDDGDGCGEPVMTYTKPKAPKTAITTPVDDDEFSDNKIGLQWQWMGNPGPTWPFADKKNGVLRLFSQYDEASHNLFNVNSFLGQKTPAKDFTVTTRLSVYPDKRYTGEKFFFGIMGEDYSMICIENTAEGLKISQNTCIDARKKGIETAVDVNLLPSRDVVIRMTMTDGQYCNFSYSTDDGATFKAIGTTFKAKEGRWIGAKIGYIASRPKKSNDGGYMDIDWIRYSKPDENNK
jgi:beta-xylosidase